MIIKIPFKTPTINHLYGQRGFRKFLKPEAKLIREQIRLQLVMDNRFKDIDFDIETPLSVSVKIYEDWYTKKGDVKRKDISNREKFLIDSIFDVLDIDDKMIFKHTMEKIQSTDGEKAIVEIKNYWVDNG